MKNKKTLTIGVSIVFVFLLVVGMGAWKLKNNREIKVVEQAMQQQQGIQNQQAAESELVWYKVPELGVQFKVEKDMKDELIYNYKGENTATNLDGKTAGKVKTIGFSTKTLANLDKNCSSEKGALGYLEEWDGKSNQFDAIKNFKNGLKQFDSFVITYEDPQAPCSINYTGDPNQKTEDPIRMRYVKYLSSDAFMQSIEIAQ